MADTHETSTDVIAAMRGGPIPQHRHDRELLCHFANRFEAAHKREIVEVSTRAATFAINKTNEEWRQKLGDAAKLREALKATLDLFWDIHNANRSPQSNQAYAVIRKIKAALSAPPRNCDRFTTVDEARKAHEAICEKYGKCHNGCPLNNEEHYSAFDCFEAWLFAPATEQKGGAE